MSKIIPFPGVRRPVFSCVDGGSDGLFVLHKETFGPFPDPSEAREFAANISARANIPVDWETFPQPYVPDPRNGEVYATETFLWDSVDGVENFDGFAVVHMSSGGGSAGVYGNYETLEEAQAAAVRIARERNAVLS
jgi:hypothetical protein